MQPPEPDPQYLQSLRKVFLNIVVFSEHIFRKFGKYRRSELRKGPEMNVLYNNNLLYAI